MKWGDHSFISIATEAEKLAWSLWWTRVLPWWVGRHFKKIVLYILLYSCRLYMYSCIFYTLLYIFCILSYISYTHVHSILDSLHDLAAPHKTEGSPEFMSKFRLQSDPGTEKYTEKVVAMETRFAIKESNAEVKWTIKIHKHLGGRQQQSADSLSP